MCQKMSPVDLPAEEEDWAGGAEAASYHKCQNSCLKSSRRGIEDSHFKSEWLYLWTTLQQLDLALGYAVTQEMSFDTLECKQKHENKTEMTFALILEHFYLQVQQSAKLLTLTWTDMPSGFETSGGGCIG